MWSVLWWCVHAGVSAWIIASPMLVVVQQVPLACLPQQSHHVANKVVLGCARSA
jgi:hypothetical protein